MGEEIEKFTFTDEDYARFQQNLTEETELLKSYFENDKFLPGSGNVIGLELEAWLVDQNFRPSPKNKQVLEDYPGKYVVPELSQFNVEYVSDPYYINPETFTEVYGNLTKMWKNLYAAAQKNGVTPVAVGILPSLKQSDLVLENMSIQNRYHALNSELLRLRCGNNFCLNIEGHETLNAEFDNLMIESVTTSLQIHTQVNLHTSKRYYNAALFTCIPLVALAGNAPYLFGKDLWDETRIPTFEQVINTCNDDAIELPDRVFMGSGFIKENLFECFEENLNNFKPLLPIDFESDPADFKHLMLHNGTAWRWIRPLIGINKKSEVHLRIEQRTPSAGPSLKDVLAHIVFYLGLLTEMAQSEEAPESMMEFESLKDSFYNACRFGLSTPVNWPGQKKQPLNELIVNVLLEKSAEGLKKMGFSKQHYEESLMIIKERAESGQTGSVWMRQFLQKHPGDFEKLVEAYSHNQQQDIPVHKWSI